MYHVGKPGTLDSSTIGLLSRPRCGNPDDLEDLDTVEDLPEPELGDEDVLHYPAYRRHQRSTDGLRKEESETEMVPQLSHSTATLRKANDAVKFSSNRKQDSPDRNVSTIRRKLNPESEDFVPDQEALKKVALEIRAASRSRFPSVEQHTEWEPHPSVSLDYLLK